MKKQIITIALLLGVLSTATAYSSSKDLFLNIGYLYFSGDPVNIKITENTSLEDLKKIQNELKEKGIELTIQSTDYNPEGKLTSISLKLVSGNSKVKSSFKSDSGKPIAPFCIIREYDKYNKMDLGIKHCD
ncbi:MAG: hypothetical protein ABI855_13855 [Bacteroidota bacterium]